MNVLYERHKLTESHWSIQFYVVLDEELIDLLIAHVKVLVAHVLE